MDLDEKLSILADAAKYDASCASSGGKGRKAARGGMMEVTNEKLAIIRLHGRRTATWETRNDIVTERYRYLYDHAQLVDWLPSVRRAMAEAREVHLIFNNNHANYATTNAREMNQIVIEDIGSGQGQKRLHEGHEEGP